MSKVKKESKEGILKLFYNKRDMIQGKILIQLFLSWKLRVPPLPSLLDLAGKIN